MLSSCSVKDQKEDGFSYRICGEALSGPVKPYSRSCGTELVVDSHVFQGKDFDTKVQGNENSIHLYQFDYLFELDSVCQLEKFRLKANVKVNKSYDLNSFTIHGWMDTHETGNFDEEEVFQTASGEVDQFSIDSTSSQEFNHVIWEIYRPCEDGRYPFIHPDSIYSVSVQGRLHFELTHENNENLAIQKFHENVGEVAVSLQAPLAE